MTLGLPFPLPGGLKLHDPLSYGGKADQFRTVGSILSALLPYIFVVGGLVLFAMLLTGGFEILTSVGNEEKMKGGSERIKNSLIGFLLLFSVYWLAQIIQVLFKMPVL